MVNKTKISIIFWSHFAVATISHFAIIATIIGMVSLVTSTIALPVAVKAMLFSIVFFVGMYCTNHVTNHEGFCVLTDLENFYRRKEGMPIVDAFTPRYYRKIGSIMSSIKCLFTKCPRKDKK